MTASGAAAAIAPEPEHGSGPVATADDVITFADLKDRERQLASTGACAHPVRLHGRVTAIDLATGEAAPVYDTAERTGRGAARRVRQPPRITLPGLLGRLQARRPPARPRGPDRRQRRPRNGRCPSVRVRHASPPRRSARCMPAGCAARPCCPAAPAATLTSGSARTAATSPARSGTPSMIPGSAARCARDCYDYEAAVLFNLHATALWRRFTTYLPRHLARLAGVTRKTLKARAADPLRQGRRIPGTRRHPLPRRDPPRRPHQRRVHPAPGPLQRRAAVRRHRPGRQGRPHHRARLRRPDIRLRFGRELDTRPIWRQPFAATGRALDPAAVANYIAKYVTKAVDVPGLPDTRIRHASEIGALRCPAHHKRMVAMAWDLGARTSVGDPRLRLWAHQLGFGGHPLTKSRRYSVTFGYIRGERVTARRLERHPDGERDPWGRPLDDRVVLVLANWSYAGTGYTPRTPAAELALASADMARAR